MKTLGALRTDCDILLVIHRTIIITWARSVVLILSIRCVRNVFTRTCVVGNHIVNDGLWRQSPLLHSLITNFN